LPASIFVNYKFAYSQQLNSLKWCRCFTGCI